MIFLDVINEPFLIIILPQCVTCEKTASLYTLFHFISQKSYTVGLIRTYKSNYHKLPPEYTMRNALLVAVKVGTHMHTIKKHPRANYLLHFST
jgi:hypothetical protein